MKLGTVEVECEQTGLGNRQVTGGLDRWTGTETGRRTGWGGKDRTREDKQDKNKNNRMSCSDSGSEDVPVGAQVRGRRVIMCFWFTNKNYNSLQYFCQIILPLNSSMSSIQKVTKLPVPSFCTVETFGRVFSYIMNNHFLHFNIEFQCFVDSFLKST